MTKDEVWDVVMKPTRSSFPSHTISNYVAGVRPCKAPLHSHRGRQCTFSNSHYSDPDSTSFNMLALRATPSRNCAVNCTPNRGTATKTTKHRTMGAEHGTTESSSTVEGTRAGIRPRQRARGQSKVQKLCSPCFGS